jgi:bifunctional non-homologous end joining protein LigD
MAKSARKIMEVDGEEVSISSPDKLFFPQAGITKLDLIHYYLAIAEGALRGAGGRPVVMKRFPKGAEGEFFFQKRAPTSRPDFLETVTLRFPSRRTAEEVVMTGAPTLVWCTHMGCLDINPHPIRADDLQHPDELRMDLDPVPGVEWPQIRDVGFVTKEVLDDLGLVGWPKTSGSRGLHINVRLERAWGYDDVRLAAVAIAREVERRAPDIATARWWKEERQGVFLDYNQNTKDRTVASAYSVRPTPDARVSTPITWDELKTIDPGDFTVHTVPERFKAIGDPAKGIDETPCRLDKALLLAEQQANEGASDAPWPPHYPKGDAEPPRVNPSRRKVQGPTPSAKGRRQSKMPLIEIARAEKKADAEAALEQWKATHPDAAAHLEPANVLTDAMRGRYTTWTRIRINLVHVPEALRPPQEALIVDYDPWQGMSFPGRGETGDDALPDVNGDD